MKQFIVILIAISFFIPVQSQTSGAQVKVRKAAYFDKTPPLRDMKIIMPGERKRAWKDGIIKNESVEMDRRKAGEPESGSYDVIQNQFGPEETRGPILSYDGIGNVNGVYPPDTDGDVGPDHFFQMINLSFAIWDKEGNKLFGPVDNSTLWEGFIGPWTGSNDGDPIILYDEAADRWVATQFAIEQPNGKSYELVAVSATGDPLGEYYRYAFEFDDFNDYPKVGVWRDGYYATFNFFDQGFIGSGVAAFEREKMLAGDPDAQMVFFGYFPGKFSLQPSDFDGQMPPEGAPNYIATMNAFGSKQLEIYEFSVDWENPSNSTYQLGVSLDPGFFSIELDGIPQPNTSTRLDDLAVMLMYRLAYRNFDTHETLLANHTVNVSGRAGIKWYELRKVSNSDWYIHQQGVYAPDDGLHRWMGSMAMNEQGTIALGFSISGNDKYPSIRYTGRPADAPLGEMTYEEVEAMTGYGSQSGINRWGDYSCLNVDPVHDSVFWFTTEYMNFSWKTRIVSFDFGPVLPPEVYAGPDATICQDTFYYANGSAFYSQSWEWTTSGDGVFIAPNQLYSPYLRGNQDLENGEVTLTLTAQGYGAGLEDSDDLLLSFTYKPVVDAGNDTTIHTSSLYHTDAMAENYESLVWSTSGDGSFADPTALQTVYTPGSGDIENGEVMLTLNAMPLDPCSFGESDDVTVTLDATIGIDEYISEVDFRVGPNPASGEFTVSLSRAAPPAQINIVNSSGSVIFTERIDQENYSKNFDFKYLPKGIYIIQFSSGSQFQEEKIVIQ